MTRGNLLSLEALLDPIGTRGFRDDYLEHGHWISRRAFAPNDVQLPTELAPVLRRERAAPPTSMWFHTDGDLRDASCLVTTISDTGAVLLLPPGATLVVRAIHRHTPALRELVNDVGETFDTNGTLSANLFYTPAQCQGLRAHYDLENLFVLQLAGKKTWRLCGRPALPVHDMHPSEERMRDLSKQEAHEVTIREGDLMYLPRGLIHAARTDDSPSLHVTVGFGVVTVRDVVDVMISRDGASNGDEGWRSRAMALPPLDPASVRSPPGQAQLAVPDGLRRCWAPRDLQEAATFVRRRARELRTATHSGK